MMLKVSFPPRASTFLKKQTLYCVAILFFCSALMGSGLVADEIKHMEKTFEKFKQTRSESDFYTERNDVRKILREELKRHFKENSRLAAFPQLDTETFNESIRYLQAQWEKCEYKSKAPLLLSIWSLISGIEVVGLKEKGDYYFANEHLAKFLKPAERALTDPIVVGFNGSNICIRKEGRCHHHGAEHIPIPRAFLKSAVIYRSNLNTQKINGVEEDQRIVWDFLKDETLSLENLNQKFEEAEDTLNMIHSLLNSVLRLTPHDRLPLYSLGIVNLFKNTTIYISLCPGHSRHIVGPCSVAGASYVGLKDGIFIETNSRSMYQGSIIDYLFGVQFASRAFCRMYESARTEGLTKTVYFPHYEFTNIDRMLKEAGLNKGDNTFSAKIGGSFRRLVQKVEDPEREKIIDLIAYMIKKMDKRQLCIQLSSKDIYEKINGKALFEPSVAVDLARVPHKPAITDKRLAGILISNDTDEDSDDTSKINENLISIDKVLKLLCCVEYQHIEKLNLSGNALSSEGAADIAKLLAKNVAPRLLKLDLSDNRIEDDDELKEFQTLLARDNFQCLILFSNLLTKRLPLSKKRLRAKVIWVDKESLDRFNAAQRIDEKELAVHQKYYAQG
jgi:hypothetical protein